MADSESEMNPAQTNLSRRDNMKIARRFNAGKGTVRASSPAGTPENARPILLSFRDVIHFASLPGANPDIQCRGGTPGYSQASLRDEIRAEARS